MINLHRDKQTLVCVPSARVHPHHCQTAQDWTPANTQTHHNYYVNVNSDADELHMTNHTLQYNLTRRTIHRTSKSGLEQQALIQ